MLLVVVATVLVLGRRSFVISGVTYSGNDDGDGDNCIVVVVSWCADVIDK